jgi:1,2-diacylglycerol 3-beta-galactosyltransferase
MTNRKRRILILTADMGFGHRSAANAVRAAMEELHGHEAILRENENDYDKLVREMPKLYRLGYQFIDTPISSAIIESGLTVLLYEALDDILRSFKPDVVIVTKENYLTPLNAVFTMTERAIPVVTIITDLGTVHRMWFNDVSSYTLVPTQRVYGMAVQARLPTDRVKITGIPVHPRLTKETRDPAAIRAELGCRADLTTVLAVGGTRVNNMGDALNVLNHSNLPIQIIAIAGGDDALYVQWQTTEWHVPTKVYNFVDNMPTLLRAADCILCKAGGLIVTEALASGLPIMLVDVIQGQETGNAEFVVENGAGELVRTPVQVLEVMCHWLLDKRQLLLQYAENAQRVGRPRSAYDAAELAWASAAEGQHVHAQPQAQRSGLADLLNNFNIPWKRPTGSEGSLAD